MERQIELPLDAPVERTTTNDVITAANMWKLRDEFLADKKVALVMLCESHENLRRECIRYMQRVRSLEQRIVRASQLLNGLD